MFDRNEGNQVTVQANLARETENWTRLLNFTMRLNLGPVQPPIKKMAFFSHFMAFFLKNRLGCFPGPTLKNIMALKFFVIFGLIFFLMAFFF